MGDTCMSAMTKLKGVTAFRSGMLIQLGCLKGEETPGCSTLVETLVEAEVKYWVSQKKED